MYKLTNTAEWFAGKNNFKVDGCSVQPPIPITYASHLHVFETTELGKQLKDEGLIFF